MRLRALGVLLVGACSVTTEPIPFNAPPQEDFRYVSGALAARCGSLDCHGGAERSLRLYGRFGLRLDGDDVPGGSQDSAEEHAANYASVLALEPELMHKVVRSGGRQPERLTLFRKGRGVDRHEGGRAFNDDTDSCLTSWVAGNLDRKTCFEASQVDSPPGFTGTGGGGTGGGGTGGGGTGGSSGTGGGGTGGSSGTGGGNTGGGGGVVCSEGDFWPCTWDAACKPEKPAPADHIALAYSDCLSCHSVGGDAGSAQPFLLAGIIWEWGQDYGKPGIEIGVRDGSLFYYACTDSNGFYFIRDTGQPVPDWKKTETRARGEFADKVMPEEEEHGASCNGAKCHGDFEHRVML